MGRFPGRFHTVFDVTEGADYVVKIVGKSGEPAHLARGAQEVYSVGINGRQEGDKKVVICRMMRPEGEGSSGSPALSPEDGGDREQ